MTVTVDQLDQPSSYLERRSGRDRDSWEALKSTTTLYVGNLCGEIKRIIMGLDRFQKTPCGFCFVEYYAHEAALDCMKYINGTKLDERTIRTDLDPGYKDGRQYGRGKSGGQVRDEHREDYDGGRGGWGRRVEAERKRAEEQGNSYIAIQDVPLGEVLEAH